MRYFVHNIIFCERWHFPPESYISLTLENTQSLQIQVPQSLLTLNALPAVWSCLNCLCGLLPGSGLLEPPPPQPTHCTGVPAWPPPIIWAVLRRAERGQVSPLPPWGPLRYGLSWWSPASRCLCLQGRGCARPVFRALDKAFVKVPGLWRWTNPSWLGSPVTSPSPSVWGWPMCPVWLRGNCRPEHGPSV